MAQMKIDASEYRMNVRPPSFGATLTRIDRANACHVFELVSDDNKTLGFYLTYRAAAELVSRTSTTTEPDAYLAAQFGQSVNDDMNMTRSYRHVQEGKPFSLIIVTAAGALRGFILSLEAANQLGLEERLIYPTEAAA